MEELTLFLKDLISVPGLSAYEGPAREIIKLKWAGLTDEIRISKLGSLHALRKGTGTLPRPVMMLACHMDSIGLMAASIVEGFIRITKVGGVDPRILPGQPVQVIGKEILNGVICQPADRLLPAEFEGKPVPLEHLLVDVGLPHEEVIKLVRLGDLVCFNSQPLDLSGDTLAGHTLDDRAAVAAVTHCLKILQKRTHAWDVQAVATVQEETTFGGAYTSAFDLLPDIGIAIDVCHAKGPGTSEPDFPVLGKGLVLDIGPNVHPYLFVTFKNVAEEMEIPYVVGTSPTHTGTDAYAIQVTGSGIPSMVISIPLRYMHTPVEMVSIKDIRRTGRLLAEFITHLEADYLEKINWEKNDAAIQ
jgi:endoglucanase